jgi:hypothetical protein
MAMTSVWTSTARIQFLVENLLNYFSFNDLMGYLQAIKELLQTKVTSFHMSDTLIPKKYEKRKEISCYMYMTTWS